MLLVDPHIVRIEEAESWDHFGIDCNLFRKNYGLKHQLRLMQILLFAPYICDDFVDHYKRDDWRQFVLEKYGEEALRYVQNNALRGALTNVVHHITDFFNEKNYIGTNRDTFVRLLSEMRYAYADLDDNRGPVSPVDKVKVVKQKAYAVLKFLSEQKPIQE